MSVLLLVCSLSCDAYCFGCLMWARIPLVLVLTDIGFPPHVEFRPVQPLALNYFQNSLFPLPMKATVVFQLRYSGKGGFNLTKFVNNSKNVLHSIPKAFRKNSVKDKDLGRKLPDEHEQVLSILLGECRS